jgi:polysaccharide biosynthesis/export protein
MKKKLFILFFPALMLFFASCVPSKKLLYFRENLKKEIDTVYFNPNPVKYIKAMSELYIKILSTDQETALIFSREHKDRYSFDVNLISYRVDKEGYIDFPFIGKILLKGKTLDEAKTLLHKEIQPYISNASILMKFVNNKFTILGEVNNPGDYYYINDHLTIFKAIGMAGGIKDFGNKKELILIREIDGSISYHRVNLTKEDIVSSPYFHLYPDDVIVVNPIRAKYWAMTSFNWGTFLSLITTILATLYYFDTQR